MDRAERDAEIVEHFLNGWTQGEAADHYHLTQGTVSKIARKAGLTMAPRKRRPLIAADLLAAFARVRAEIAAKYNTTIVYVEGIERTMRGRR